MDLELMQKGLDYAKKKRKWVFVAAITCYGLRKVYNSPCVVKKRRSLSKFFYALLSVAQMVSDSADAVRILSKDLKQFLSSDSDQLPQSLKQLSKIAKSSEFSDALTRTTRASVVGILSAYRHESIKGGGDRAFSDVVTDKLFSDAGAGFASAVVGSFARSMVMTLLSQWPSSKDDDSRVSPPWWIEVVCEDKCRETIGDFIRQFVSTAVTVYLEKTADVKTYEELFSGLTDLKHESRVRDMLASLCNGAVETCVRTSYHAWRANSAAASKLNSSWDERGKLRRAMGKNHDESGWGRVMRSTLVVPRNREFALDVTGVVTFESVRSFLEVVTEKVSEGIKTSVDVVQQEVVEKGVEAIRYASGRSSALTALCLTLCFNILNSPWILT